MIHDNDFGILYRHASTCSPLSAVHSGERDGAAATILSGPRRLSCAQTLPKPKVCAEIDRSGESSSEALGSVLPTGSPMERLVAAMSRHKETPDTIQLS